LPPALRGVSLPPETADQLDRRRSSRKEPFAGERENRLGAIYGNSAPAERIRIFGAKPSLPCVLALTPRLPHGARKIDVVRAHAPPNSNPFAQRLSQPAARFLSGDVERAFS
jgi:hypothetical protein